MIATIDPALYPLLSRLCCKGCGDVGKLAMAMQHREYAVATLVCGRRGGQHCPVTQARYRRDHKTGVWKEV